MRKLLIIIMAICMATPIALILIMYNDEQSVIENHEAVMDDVKHQVKHKVDSMRQRDGNYFLLTLELSKKEPNDSIIEYHTDVLNGITNR